MADTIKFLAAFILYFGPTLVAIVLKHRSVGGILVLNALLGWTIIGWIIAAIWSLSNPGISKKDLESSKSGSRTEELTRLHKLKEEGAISQQEYDSEKKRLLS